MTAPATPTLPLIGFGQVRHTRLRPKKHAFAYRTFFLMLPMRSLAGAPSAHGRLAVNRRGAISFHDVDHGDGRSAAQGGALAWLDELLRTEGITDATASLERVQGRDVRAWMPNPREARTLYRLQSEMQMLLYTHPFNDARGARGLPAINSFWVHGTGALPPGLTAPAQPPQVADALRAPALREDWRAWASAWTTLDAGPLAELLRQAEQGHPVRRTMSGEHSAQSFHTAPLGLVQRIQRFLRPQRFMDVREQL